MTLYKPVPSFLPLLAETDTKTQIPVGWAERQVLYLIQKLMGSKEIGERERLRKRDGHRLRSHTEKQEVKNRAVCNRETSEKTISAKENCNTTLNNLEVGLSNFWIW